MQAGEDATARPSSGGPPSPCRSRANVALTSPTRVPWPSRRPTEQPSQRRCHSPGLGSVQRGLRTAMVYPTLVAAIGDVAHRRGQRRRLSPLRDVGHVAGAILSGPTADLLGVPAAITPVAAARLGCWRPCACRRPARLDRCPALLGHLHPEPGIFPLRKPPSAAGFSGAWPRE